MNDMKTYKASILTVVPKAIMHPVTAVKTASGFTLTAVLARGSWYRSGKEFGVGDTVNFKVRHDQIIDERGYFQTSTVSGFIEKHTA